MGIHEGGLQKGEEKLFEKKLTKEEKQALMAEKKAALAVKKAAKKAQERPSGEGDGSEGEGEVEEEQEDGWTADEQAALEEALRRFPVALPNEERWGSISEHVGRRCAHQTQTRPRACSPSNCYFTCSVDTFHLPATSLTYCLL